MKGKGEEKGRRREKGRGRKGEGEGEGEGRGKQKEREKYSVSAVTVERGVNDGRLFRIGEGGHSFWTKDFHTNIISVGSLS